MNFAVRKCLTLVLIGLGLLHTAENSKILVVFSHLGRSHFDVFEPYLEQLAAKGHQLLVISHFPRKRPTPNYKDIDLKAITKVNQTVNILSYADIAKMDQIVSAFVLSAWAAEVCENAFEHPDVQKLIKSDEKFDLLITETFNTDCFLAFAHRFQIPVIGFSSCVFMPWTPDRVGNPDNPAYIPTQFVASSDRMDFTERFSNTFWYLFHKLHYSFLMDPRAHKIAKKHFGESLPALSTLARNTSLIFVNNHFSVNRPRPLVPGIVEVGGIHMKPAKTLSKRILSAIDACHLKNTRMESSRKRASSFISIDDEGSRACT
ncbi:UDP-glucuronosyltransferase 3A1-like isoform X2 [Zootermopsis nevadensis]|uniref:UDP-glucuronosyltransferase 3A1-like isoform X2 n=1 Tax=Zootermopsis nevadensis TaxID=136037 RepID=UPI000B8E5994|nr:UDP-glucuronosyltransferase 3A1-like isoform X2 [Zootermopsis nevadensis]XP_021917405.1 UDP-glucuronosyltransferase 3A1-like isoform X2 [Zootermopsis nevadensis]